MKRYALIVAGGIGARMNRPIPKQFIKIAGRPILMYTIQKFYDLSADIDIILVLPERAMDTWATLVEEYSFNIPLRLVAGGEARVDSVKNGLAAIAYEESLVAIHDGVRPFVKQTIIEESYRMAAQKGNAIATVKLKDSIREIVDEETSQSLDRSRFRLVQTPQTFQTKLIKGAYHGEGIDKLTDDASVAEHAGMEIHLIEGDYKNIKITTPEDLEIAEAFIKSEQ